MTRPNGEVTSGCRPYPPEMKALRVKARRELQRAIAAGTIVPATRCEKCKNRQARGKSRRSTDGIKAHHEDYRFPLAVNWLCHWCHCDADEAKFKREKAAGQYTEARQPTRKFIGDVAFTCETPIGSVINAAIKSGRGVYAQLLSCPEYDPMGRGLYRVQFHSFRRP